MIEHEFDPVTIPSCKSADIFIRAQRTFRPEFLFIPKEIAGDFLITDIKIGKDTQMLGPGCIPAAIFSTSAVPELLSGFKLVKAAETMRLSITNQSADPRTFSGTLRGSTDKRKTDPANKKHFLGYGSTCVAALSSALISVQPSLDFRPFRLIVPSTITPKFKIMGMSIRSRNLELIEKMDSSYLDHPFDENSLGQVSFVQSCLNKKFLTLDVENTTNHSQNFQGAVIGFSLYDQ